MQQFNNLKFNNMAKFMKKIQNGYEKFQIRGAIKEIMRNYGLRSISLSNYFKYLNTTPTVKDVHSVKYDIMNGYIKVHKYRDNDTRCGEVYDTVDINTYKSAYNTILDILNDEDKIPSKIKRNILVKVNR